MPFVKPILLWCIHHKLRVFRDFLLMASCSHFSQEFNKRSSNWLGKAVMQGKENRKGTLTTSREPQSDQLAFLVLVLVHMVEWIQRCFEYEATSANFFYLKYLKLCGITVWMSGCLCIKGLVWMANISWWFLSSKLGKNSEFSWFQKQGKNYWNVFKSTQNPSKSSANSRMISVTYVTSDLSSVHFKFQDQWSVTKSAMPLLMTLLLFAFQRQTIRTYEWISGKGSAAAVVYLFLWHVTDGNYVPFATKCNWQQLRTFCYDI